MIYEAGRQDDDVSYAYVSQVLGKSRDDGAWHDMALCMHCMRACMAVMDGRVVVGSTDAAGRCPYPDGCL